MTLGLVALALGWGVVGLAGVSIITNCATLGILGWQARQYGILKGLPSLTNLRGALPGGAMLRGMLGDGFPLMLNHFLATIFFKVDVVLIEAFHGARMVGLYNVAYKWVDALNIIPAFFTMALLPVMSRQAQADRAALSATTNWRSSYW